jgi:hypothetical protein
VLAAVLIILVLGIGLPAVGWWGSRKRMSGPDPDHDEIDRWLIGQYRLAWNDRAEVRRAVLGLAAGDVAPRKPGPLRPELIPAARALAGRVLDGQLSAPRIPRPVGWVLLCVALAYTGGGVRLLITPGRDHAQGALYVLLGVAETAVVVVAVLLARRRARRRAEGILRGTRVDDLAGPAG